MTIRHTTLRQLEVFEAAARRLSFTRAAAELHLSQPAVSMQVKELEAHAGIALFERVGRRLFLSDAGREFLGHAREVLQTLATAEDALEERKGLRGGRVAVAVTSTAKYFAPQLLARFRKLHPHVALRLAVNNREAVVEQLASNEVDLAIMGRPPQAPDAVGEVFAPHPFVIVASPDHPLARVRRIALADLAQETMLVREPGSGTRAAMNQLFSEHRLALHPGMEIASNETIKQAVMAGIGISFISRHTVGFELQSRRLIALDVMGLPVLRHWYVVHLVAKRLAPSAAAFKAFVLDKGRALLKAHVGGH